MPHGICKMPLRRTPRGEADVFPSSWNLGSRGPLDPDTERYPNTMWGFAWRCQSCQMRAAPLRSQGNALFCRWPGILSVASPVTFLPIPASQPCPVLILYPSQAPQPVTAMLLSPVNPLLNPPFSNSIISALRTPSTSPTPSPGHQEPQGNTAFHIMEAYIPNLCKTLVPNLPHSSCSLHPLLFHLCLSRWSCFLFSFFPPSGGHHEWTLIPGPCPSCPSSSVCPSVFSQRKKRNLWFPLRWYFFWPVGFIPLHLFQDFTPCLLYLKYFSSMERAQVSPSLPIY